MRKYRVVIIDDEPNARMLLREMIRSFCTELEVVGEARDLPSGVKEIIKHKPELIFLDIEMPGFSGIEIMDFFEEATVNFSIIFTTAYDRYAVKAFKLPTVDYLLKPIEPEELENTVRRFFKRNTTTKIPEKTPLPNQEPSKIAVPTSQGLKVIETENIILIKADNTYSEIYFNDNTKLIVSRSLKNFEDSFVKYPNFFRSSKSYIVNMRYVEEYIKAEGGYLRLKNGYEATISTEKVSAFLSLLLVINR